MNTSRQNIVIVGTGFGGMHAYVQLHKIFHGKKNPPRVTFISKQNYFLFNLMLHEVATGIEAPQNLMQSVRGLFGGCSCGMFEDLMLATVTGVDTTQKKIKTQGGDVSYDYAIIAIGATTRMYGFDPTVALPLKNLNDASHIKNKILENVAAANRAPHGAARNALLNFVIIGGGPTGVELATEIDEYLHKTLLPLHPNIDSSEPKVYIIQAGSELVPAFNSFVRRKVMRRIKRLQGVELITNIKAQEIGSQNVTLDNGRKIETNLVVLAAGVQPNPIAFTPDVVTVKTGQVEVNQFLQLPGASHTFVIGDLAAIQLGDGYVPQTAQAAKYEGVAAAKNIAAMILDKKIKPYKDKNLAQIVSLGTGRAAGNLLGVNISSLPGWVVWKGVYAYNFFGWGNRIRIVLNWIINFFYDRDTTKL